MKKLLLGLSLLIGLSFAGSQSANAFALFYGDVDYPVIATGVTAPCDLSKLKVGKSSAVNILYFVEIGDAGIEKAVKDGCIQKINFIDINEKTVFIFFKRITTSVYGE